MGRMRIHVSWCLWTFAVLLAAADVRPQARPDARQDHMILLRGQRFDPLESAARRAAEKRMTATSETSWMIVQFDRQLTRQESALVKRTIGLRLDEYIPRNAFLEKLSGEQVDELRRLEYYRWAGPYESVLKIDPNIGKHKFETPRRRAQPGILLTVVAFPDVDLRVLARRIRGLGFEIVSTTDEPQLRILRLQVRVHRASDATRIAELEEVKYMEEVGEVTLNNGTTSWVLQSNLANSRPLWGRQLRGEGQIIGHIDDVIDMNSCFFQDAVDNTIRPDHRKVVGQRNSSASAFGDHGTFSAGNAAGEDFNNDALSAVPNANNGNAPRARLTSGNLSDLDLNAGGGTSVSNYLSQAVADGAFIHTNSWDPKNTNNYTQVSADIDRFTWENEDQLVIFGPDNAGPIRPGTNAKNNLVVNATQQSPNQNNFSSGVTQFTQDGRRKPDVMGPGATITSADGGTACGTRVAGGTSFAAPAVAGIAALVRQYYTEGWYPTGTQQPNQRFTPTGNLLKATIANSAVDATGIAGYPGANGMGEGWGRVLIENALYFAGDARNLMVWDVRNASGLFAAESRTHAFTVAGAGQPLRVTLVWSEPNAPANTTAGPAEAVGSLTINELDLVVTAPNGDVFTGNDINTATGTSNANGGVADGLNLLEQVALPNPQVGNYTITVREGANGIAQGPLGYALVVSADLPEPPVPTGAQNTLVVRTALSDILAGALPSQPNVANIVTAVQSYVSEVSYGVASINPSYAEVTLTQPSTFYYHPSRNPLVELTEDVVAALIAANPNAFDQGTANPADDIGRMIIVLNDPNLLGDWATTGPWPYNLPAGLTRRISVSVNSVHNPEARFTHGLGHQFGLVDLYAHPPVVFPQPHVDTWDHMAYPFLNTGFMAWSKERATWISAHGSSVQYVPRPASGVVFNQTIGLNFVSSTGANRKAIAFGLTEGAAAIGNENAFYFVEARSNAAGSVDSVLPESGVLLYHVNESVPQGQGPLRVIDDELGTATLDDGALEVGDTKTTSTGLTVTVQNGTGGADRDIQVSYDPPDTDNDVRMATGDPAWMSPDIWVDSQKDGFDTDRGRTPGDRGDQAVEGEVNRLYVRVHNPGPGAAFDFTIFVRISEPHHTVGGVADFNRFVGQLFVPQLAAGADYVGYIEWTPDEDGNPHSCVEVEIPNVFNDVNPNNNRAQRNLQEVTSSTSSPYDQVTYPFRLTNGEDHPQLYYFRVEDLPSGWTSTLAPRSALLVPGQLVDGSLTVKPPDNAPVCTEQRIKVTSWKTVGDTMVAVGGSTLQVDLRKRTLLTANTGLRSCARTDPVINAATVAAAAVAQKCAQVTVQGCTNPPRPNQQIVVRYEHPAGYPVYHTVTTDAAGCYSDFLVVTEGGPWEVSAEYPGDDCNGGATTPGTVVTVGLPSSGDTDGDGRPDPDEPQGDHDQDGIPGIFDDDSDADGVKDGDESAGDCDRDGLANVVDPDSDNDGVRDGRDLTPCGKGDPRYGRFETSFHVGSAHPLGRLDDVADANVYVAADLGYRLTDRFTLRGLFGLAQSTAETAALIEHPRWLHMSVNLEATLPTPTGLRLYARVGPGWYLPKSGSGALGFNVGVGGRIPIKAPFSLEFGTDLHNLTDDADTRFLTLHLGVLFR